METREERASYYTAAGADVFGLAYVAAAAEDNSSWFFSIPNEEFTRVLGDIYSQRGGAAPRRRGAERGVLRAPDSLSLLNGAHARAVGAAGGDGERWLGL